MQPITFSEGKSGYQSHGRPGRAEQAGRTLLEKARVVSEHLFLPDNHERPTKALCCSAGQLLVDEQDE